MTTKQISLFVLACIVTFMGMNAMDKPKMHAERTFPVILISDQQPVSSKPGLKADSREFVPRQPQVAHGHTQFNARPKQPSAHLSNDQKVLQFRKQQQLAVYNNTVRTIHNSSLSGSQKDEIYHALKTVTIGETPVVGEIMMNRMLQQNACEQSQNNILEQKIIGRERQALSHPCNALIGTQSFGFNISFDLNAETESQKN